MTERHYSDRDLDEAIDAVARGMMAQDASPAFRARVAASLDGTGGRRPGAFGWRFALAAGAVVAAAAIGISLWMLGSAPRTDQPGQGVASAVPGPPSAPARTAPAETLVTRPDTQPTEAVAATRTRPVRTRAGRAAPAAEGGPTAPERALVAGPPPLPEPAPITIATFEPDALAIGEIAVEPLDEIQPITIPAPSVGAIDPQRRPDR